MIVAFYIAAAVAVLATGVALTRANAVHALLNLVVSLFATAVVMFTLGAPFVAALEVIVYAGAIMVLFIFVVMLLRLGQDETGAPAHLYSPRTWAFPALLTLVLAGEMGWLLWGADFPATAMQEVPPKAVGVQLMGPWMLAVEMASMLLLAGLVAAYHLGRRDER
ncbi:MAG: NADH-quinone oxidoreductase subunit J [Myxococcota bacterium]